MNKWQARFETLDQERPEIYKAFKRDTLERIADGMFLSGTYQMYHLRHFTPLRTDDPDSVGVKICQNYGPYLVRKFVSEHPEHAHRFRAKRTPKHFAGCQCQDCGG